MYESLSSREPGSGPPDAANGAERVCDDDLHALPADALGRDLVDISTQIGALHLEWCRRIAVWESKAGYQLDGQRTAATWLAHHTGRSRTAAGQLVKIARRLRDLPALRAAAEAGVLSWEQTRTLAMAPSDASFESFTQIEGDLVEACRHLTGEDTRRVAVQWRKVSAQADEKALADGNHLGRAVYLSKGFQGTYGLNGTMADESGRIVENAFQRLMDAQRRHDNETGDDPEDRRTISQRRHDALVDMAKLALGWDPTVDETPDGVIIDGTARPSVEIVVDLDTLTPGSLHLDTDTPVPGVLAEYLDMSPLPAETARRICCDSALGRVLTAGSLPLDVGRQTRTPNRAIRRALDLRDGGCAFPGCGTAPRLCEAHHIIHWANHGETNLENLVLVCWFHHHLIHEGHWNIQLDPHTSRPVFEAPDGRQFHAREPRPTLPRQLTTRLEPDGGNPAERAGPQTSTGG